MALLTDPVHFSNLRHIDGSNGRRGSPAHYRSSVLQPIEQTPAMRHGGNIHAVTLTTDYEIWHGKRTEKGYDDFVRKHTGKLIMTESEYQKALWCADAVMSDPLASERIRGAHEVERTWTTLGRASAGRIDVLGDGYITELKSCSCAHPESFHRGAMRLGYHAQLAWYLDGIGHPDWSAFVVAVETSPPFAVTTFELTRRCLDEGRKLYRLWLELLLTCEASNTWPAYAQSVVPLDMVDDPERLIIDGEEVEAA